jgi:hypothetical protein
MLVVPLVRLNGHLTADSGEIVVVSLMYQFAKTELRQLPQSSARPIVESQIFETDDFMRNPHQTHIPSDSLANVVLQFLGIGVTSKDDNGSTKSVS